MAGGDTFVKITNNDIFDEIKSLRSEFSTFKTENAKDHEGIEKHVVKTNGKVKANRWMVSTAITLFIICLGFLMNHLAGNS